MLSVSIDVAPLFHSGSHHFVCCVDISMPENPSSPHGNYNPLGQVREEEIFSSSMRHFA